MKGYIKLHRRILDWEWYKDNNTKTIFIHLLLNACYDNCRFMGNAVERGQYMTSLSRLSSDLNIPIRQVRTALKRLVVTGEIDMRTTNKYSLITICNYESYQIDEAKQKRKSTSKRHADDKQVTDINKNITIKEGKNNKNIIVDKNKEYLAQCLLDTSWQEVVCMQNSMTLSQVKQSLDDFVAYLFIRDEFKFNLKDFKSHYVNWLRYNKDEIIKSASAQYTWSWKGQVPKTGTYDEMLKDKNSFDIAGFEFKSVKNA